MTVTIKAKALEAFVADIFASAGCSEDEGGRIGRYLVSANLSGHDSHGVVRVPRYATQKKNGTVVADVTVDVIFSIRFKSGRNSATFLKFRELPFNCRFESQVIENGRTKFCCNSANAVDRLDRCCKHRFDSFPDCLSLRAHVLS